MNIRFAENLLSLESYTWHGKLYLAWTVMLGLDSHEIHKTHEKGKRYLKRTGTASLLTRKKDLLILI